MHYLRYVLFPLEVQVADVLYKVTSSARQPHDGAVEPGKASKKKMEPEKNKRKEKAKKKRKNNAQGTCCYCGAAYG